ncbi:hypothetical protein FXO37_03911 [Capsicum annuum]|nr:hypothetical protein FXO37_03911 [Capsicum annuum]
MEQDKARSLYICGCPGMGKSLSMEKVNKALLVGLLEAVSLPVLSLPRSSLCGIILSMGTYGEVKFLSESLLMALDTSLGHALLFFVMNVNKYRYVTAESFYKLVMAFSPVLDLHIMWLLHLCEAHQEMQSWVEDAQCVVTVAGVVMQVASFGGSNINLPGRTRRTLVNLRENQDEQALIGLLLRLDSVPGVDPTVRELRRDLSRSIMRLQEILDVVSDTKIQNWDGFLMDWDDVVERMKMDVCNERGGGNELETFCAEHLGFGA